MKLRAILVHGYQGAPMHGWRPWLKQELERAGWSVSVPAMPAPDHPVCDEWVKTIAAAIGKPEPSCALVGHSLGCTAILRYLEGLPAASRIGPIILVAGFGNDIGIPELASFCRPPLNWKAVRAHASRFVAIHSDNDPYVPLSEGENFRKKLGAELIVQKGMGHFSSSEGTTELPVVLEKLLENQASLSQ
jgi:predicted alpha/beta hydrolase family esterase